MSRATKQNSKYQRRFHGTNAAEFLGDAKRQAESVDTKRKKAENRLFRFAKFRCLRETAGYETNAELLDKS